MKKAYKNFLFFCTLLNSASLKNNQKVEVAISIFEPKGINISKESLIFIQDFFSLLSTATPYEQMIACKKAALILKKEIELKEIELKADDLFNLPLGLHKLWIATVQKEHFEQCARIFNQDLSFLEKLYGFFQAKLNSIWCSLISVFIKKTPTIIRITNGLIFYAEIECSEIFIDHESTLLFLINQNKQSIPLIIRIWDFPFYRHELLNGIKKFYQGALAQSEVLESLAEDAGSDVTETATETAAQEAQASAATQALTKAQADLDKALNPEDIEQALEQMPTNLSDAFLNTFNKVIGNKSLVPPIEQSEADFTQAINKIEQNESSFLEKAQAAQKATESTQQEYKEFEKSSFERTFNNFSQKVNQAINPLEKAMTATEKMESSFFSLGAKIKKLYDMSFLKTAMGQLRTWINKSTIGKYYATSDSLQTTAHLLSYLGKPTKFIFNYAQKFTLTNIYRAAMAHSVGKMIVSMIEQSELSMGSQIVSSWQSASDALIFVALSEKRSSLIAQQTLFFAQLSKKQETILNEINGAFTSKIATIAQNFSFLPDSSGNITIQGLLPSLFSSQQSFISQSLITTTIKSLFLTNSFFDDQLFYYAPMAAHLSEGITWYNPYRLGNWQFCSIDYSLTTKNPITSFVQYGIQSCISQKNPNGDPEIAIKNSIFAEYIPKNYFNNLTESYQIVIDCTLLEKPETPFMMGIIFNGARWISGVIDFHHQHRLFCIYSLPGQPKNTMNVGFAETFYKTLTDSADDQLAHSTTGSINNAIGPTYQLFSPSKEALLSLAQANNIPLITNPLAQVATLEIGSCYRFIITTQATQVALSIEKPDGTLLFPSIEQALSSATNPSSKGQPNNYQINLLNNLTFLYHNIGFIAAGCSAQFIIQQPTDLVYTKQQIADLNNSLTAGTST